MKRRLFPAQRAQEPGDAGFTLIEMLVVVSIIGILAAVAIPRYMAYAKTSQTAEVGRVAGAIVSAMQAYADSQGWDVATAKSNFDKSYVVSTGDTAPTAAGGGTLTDLTSKIPQLAAAANSKFNYTISASPAAAGPQYGSATSFEAVYCITATARNISGVTSGGVVLYSSSTAGASAGTGWEGRINRVPYLNAATGTTGATAGGYCLSTGLADGTYK